MKILFKFNMLILLLFLSISSNVDNVVLYTSTHSTYNATFAAESSSDIGSSMVNSQFESNISIEKIDGLNYIYLSAIEEGVISNYKFTFNNYSLGTKTIDTKTILFVLSDSNLHNKITVEAYVSVMYSNVEFNLTINNDLEFISNSINNLDDRPAEFIPTFSINTYSFGTQIQGSVIVIPTIFAYIDKLNCDVERKAYYQVGTELKEVELLGSNLTLSNTGHYFIRYSATSSAYKTYNNENTSNIFEIKIFVMSDGGVTYSTYSNIDNTIELGDYNFSLTSVVELHTSKLEEGDKYNDIKLALSNISTNFDVYNIVLIDSSYNEVNYNSKMYLSIKIDGTYDRSKTDLYYYENGNLTKLNSNIYVNKIVVDTHLNGTFIVVENNVSTLSSIMIIIIILTIILIISTLGIITTLIICFINKRGNQYV